MLSIVVVLAPVVRAAPVTTAPCIVIGGIVVICAPIPTWTVPIVIVFAIIIVVAIVINTGRAKIYARSNHSRKTTSTKN